jgi:hypothetical protein
MKGTSGSSVSSKTTSGLDVSTTSGSTISVTGNSSVISNTAGTGLVAITGANGTVLTSNGAGVPPSFQSPAASTTATNLSGGTAGQIPYQSATSTTNFTGPGTADYVLMSNGASAPTYQQVKLASSVSGTLPVSSGGTGTTLSTGTGKVVLDTAPTINSAVIGNSTLNIPTIDQPYITTSAVLPFAGNFKTLVTGVGSTVLGITGTQDYVLAGNGSFTAPSYKQVDLTTMVTGILPAANGGTGTTTSTGSGALVKQVSPTITTPTINTPTVDSANMTTQVTLPFVGNYKTLSTGAGGAVAGTALGGSGTVLTSNGASSPPSYGLVDLTASVTGTLPVNNGGTGTTSSTGTGSVVLSTSPTLTTPTVTGKQIINCGTNSLGLQINGASTLSNEGINIASSVNPGLVVSSSDYDFPMLMIQQNTAKKNVIYFNNAGGATSYFGQNAGITYDAYIETSLAPIKLKPSGTTELTVTSSGLILNPSHYNSVILATDSSGTVINASATGTGDLVKKSSPTIDAPSISTSLALPFAGNYKTLVTGASGAVTPVTGFTSTTFLRSNGASALPTYEQVNLTSDVQGILPVANGGTGVSSRTTPTQRYLSSGTSYTSPAGCTYIKVRVNGSGGGGGGGITTPAQAGGSGGGGGCVEGILAAGTYSYAIGSGGGGGAGGSTSASAGSQGGTTSFGTSQLTVAGGLGGSGGSAAGTTLGGGGGAVTIAAPTGCFIFSGNGGGSGTATSAGPGGASVSAGGGARGQTAQAATAVAGLAADAYGGGGGGGIYGSAGGAGFQGSISITEYYN